MHRTLFPGIIASGRKGGSSLSGGPGIGKKNMEGGFPKDLEEINTAKREPPEEIHLPFYLGRIPGSKKIDRGQIYSS